MVDTDFYEILGVEKTASTEEIKKAYRKLVHQTHPDKGGNNALFRMVQTAFETLGDPAKKAAYDRNRTSTNSSYASPPPPPPSSSSYRSSYSRQDEEQAQARRARQQKEYEDRKKAQEAQRERDRLQYEQFMLEKEEAVKAAAEEKIRKAKAAEDKKWFELGKPYNTYRGFVSFERAKRWSDFDEGLFGWELFLFSSTVIFLFIRASNNVFPMLHVGIALVFLAALMVADYKGVGFFGFFRWLIYKAGRTSRKTSVIKR